MRRAALAMAPILLLLGCQAPDAEPVRESGNGYLVIGGKHPQEFGFTYGDTIWEISLDRASRAVRRASFRMADTLGYPRPCLRLFGDESRYALFLRPPCAGLQKVGADSVQEWLPFPMAIVLDATGRQIGDEFIGGRLAFTTVCPGERGADGRPAQPEMPSIDGCYRVVDDWWAEDPGVRTPKGVIIPDPVRRGMFALCSREGPQGIDGEWMPAPEDIEALEEDLPESFPAPLRHWSEDRTLPLDNHGRQYAGFTRHGKRFIYVNFVGFPDLGGAEGLWLRQPVFVCDGGCSHFGVEYDVEERRFVNLRCNGVA